jgi:hypothetical protein
VAVAAATLRTAIVSLLNLVDPLEQVLSSPPPPPPPPFEECKTPPAASVPAALAVAEAAAHARRMDIMPPVPTSQWADWLTLASGRTLVICGSRDRVWSDWLLPLSQRRVSCVWIDLQHSSTKRCGDTKKARSSSKTSMVHGFFDPLSANDSSDMCWSLPWSRVSSVATKVGGKVKKTRRAELHVSFNPTLILATARRPRVLILDWASLLALVAGRKKWPLGAALLFHHAWTRVLVTSALLFRHPLMQTLSTSAFVWILASSAWASGPLRGRSLVDMSALYLEGQLSSPQDLATHVLGRLRCIDCDVSHFLADHDHPADWDVQVARHVLLVLCRIVPLERLDSHAYWGPWTRWIEEQERIGSSSLDMCNWLVSTWVNLGLHRANPKAQPACSLATRNQLPDNHRSNCWPVRRQRQWLQTRDLHDQKRNLSFDSCTPYSIPGPSTACDDVDNPLEATDDQDEGDRCMPSLPFPSSQPANENDLLTLFQSWMSPGADAGTDAASIHISESSYTQGFLGQSSLVGLVRAHMHKMGDTKLCAASTRGCERAAQYLFPILSGRLSRTALALPLPSSGDHEDPAAPRPITDPIGPGPATKKRPRTKKTKQTAEQLRKTIDARQAEFDALSRFEWSWSVEPSVLARQCLSLCGVPPGVVAAHAPWAPDFRCNWVWVWSHCEPDEFDDLQKVLREHPGPRPCVGHKRPRAVWTSPLHRTPDDYEAVVVMTHLSKDGNWSAAELAVPFPRFAETPQLSLVIVDTLDRAETWTPTRIATMLSQRTGWSRLPPTSISLFCA